MEYKHALLHDPGILATTSEVYRGDSNSPASPQQYYLSETLSRADSSDGSTPGSSYIASPISNDDPCGLDVTQLQPASPETQYRRIRSASTAATSSRSPGPDSGQGTRTLPAYPEDRRRKNSHPGRDYPVCCLHPGCTAKPFKRRADLDRHYKHRHAPESLKESFNCDYPRCSRRLDPFHRLDHFRDHLREYHKEDIEKRGSGQDGDVAWLQGRKVSWSWWRCSKCLKRVHIDRNGYECPDCRTSCQARRKEARQRD